jgi:effector-binding domain-containing protein
LVERYYDHACAEKARVVAELRRMEFPVSQIKEILAQFDDEADLLAHLDRHKRALEARIGHYQNVVHSLEQIISNQREAAMAMQKSTFEVEEKVLEPLLVAGVRMKGKYSDCGKGFAKIGRALGRHLSGKPLNLYYDGEYREDDADLEACIPLRKPVEAEGISVRELPGGRCVALLHQGPYDELGRSYSKILDYISQKGYKTILPTREVYLKGPGMIFRGNPRKYLTEIQILIEE